MADEKPAPTPAYLAWLIAYLTKRRKQRQAEQQQPE